MNSKFWVILFLLVVGKTAASTYDIRLKIDKTATKFIIPKEIWLNNSDILIDIVDGKNVLIGFEGWENTGSTTNNWTPAANSNLPQENYNDQFVNVDKHGVWVDTYGDQLKMLRINYISDPLITIDGTGKYLSEMTQPINVNKGEKVVVTISNSFCPNGLGDNFLFRLDNESDRNIAQGDAKEITKTTYNGESSYDINGAGLTYFAVLTRTGIYSWYPIDTVFFSVNFPQSTVANESILPSDVTIAKQSPTQFSVSSEVDLEGVTVYSLSGQKVYENKSRLNMYLVSIPSQGTYLVSYLIKGNRKTRKVIF